VTRPRSRSRNRSRSSGRGDKKKESPSGFILSIVDGRMEGKEFHFQTKASMGRTDENEVTIIDPGISREHAQVSGRRGVFIVEDLGSSNGTRLNGEIIEGPEVLRDGDYITVGSVNVMFSNLELDVVGEQTERMTLNEKQAAKLDHTQEHDLLDLPPLKELANPVRIAIAAFAFILLVALPVLTGRALELLVAVVVLAAAGVVLWKKFPPILSKIVLKPAALAGFSLGIIFLAVLVGRIFPPPQKAARAEEWSAYLIDYAQYEQYGYNAWSMGYQPKHQYPRDQNYRDKIAFKYYKTPQRQRITLEYAACGIGEGEVAILLNGERLAYAPVVENCRYNLKLLLPSDKVKDGDNVLIFDNTRNGPQGTEAWQISYVKFREEAIPNANPRLAQQNFRLGMRMYDEREVDPQNRLKAIKHFRLVRDYLESMKKKPNLYREATRMIRIIDKQLQRKFRSAVFETQRLIKYAKYKKARLVLKRAMAYFEADKSDPRYLRLQSALKAMGG
jgi:pSer/pThr/pTyr-binding forkhead associated (FHA) protein